MTQAQKLLTAAVKRWKPPKQLSVADWADQHFYLSSEYAAEAGRWSTISFQREPLNTVSDPSVWQTVIRSCTQLLKTTVIQIGTAYCIDQDPGPILIIQPRDADAKAFSKERISPMLRDVPCLRGKVSDSKAKKSSNTIEEKWFKGGLLACTSAGSPGNLARRAIRFLFCDEEDKWVASSGSEGKPFSLALKRTATFRHRKKAIRCCSPTVAGSSIDVAYEQSDRREYYVPCPECGHKQSMMLKFRSQVRWDRTLATREEQARTARYHCESCDAGWDDVARRGAVELGEWRAHAPFAGIAGFWISELYSPWKSLGEIVLDYLMKKETAEDLKTFVNTSLAENWAEPGEVLEWRTLLDRRESFAVGTVPAGGLFLTASVDVQREDGGRLECRVNAYGENRERWAVDYRIFHGDPNDLDSPLSPWRGVEAMLVDTWPNEAGAELAIERMFVDSGDGAVTASVYAWVQKQPRPRVWAIKGDRRSDQPVGPPKTVETTTAGRKLKFGLVFKIVKSDFFKAAFYADLKRRPPTEEERAQGMDYPQGYFHIPLDPIFGDEHCKQICSEQLVTRRNKSGRTVTEWEQTRPRNEALDTAAYCDAAAWDFGANRFQPRHWEMLRQKVKDLTPAPSAETADASSSRTVAEVRQPSAPTQPRRVIRSRFMN